MSEVMTQISKSTINYNDFKNEGDIVVREIENDFRLSPVFSDTVLFNVSQQKYIAHRALRFSSSSSGINREITLFKSLLSSDKLIERITLLSVLLLISFILIILILNRYIFANVWAGFSRSLDMTENYNFSSASKLSPEESEIDEFKQLNRVLEDLTERIQIDYQNLKDLTANTSHEIQTPLAIIKGKADILLQSDNLNREEMESLGTILNTVGRLSKLNQSLLIITKIENRQFEDNDILDLGDVLNLTADNLDILISGGDFTLVRNLESCKIRINPDLLDILVSNLLKNSFLHGTPGSEIRVSIKDNLLAIRNYGDPLPFPEDKLFDRFVKSTDLATSTGIGLEIVKKICEYYEISIKYNYTDSLHSFNINFSKITVNDNRIKG